MVESDFALIDFSSLPVSFVFCRQIWEFQEKARRWQCVLELEGHGAGIVHDVSWAPNLGRTYHLVATACKDGKVRIFKIRIDPSTGKFKQEIIAELARRGQAAEVRTDRIPS